MSKQFTHVKEYKLSDRSNLILQLLNCNDVIDLYLLDKSGIKIPDDVRKELKPLFADGIKEAKRIKSNKIARRLLNNQKEL